MEMGKRLRPCPFCGGKASVGTRGRFSIVRCDDCLSAASAMGDGPEEAERAAVDLWNSRVMRGATCTIVMKQADHEYRDPKENWHAVCSECGCGCLVDEWDTSEQPPRVVSHANYCPNCGARVVDGTRRGDWATDRWGTKVERNRIMLDERLRGKTYKELGEEFGLTPGRCRDICKREKFRRDFKRDHPDFGRSWDDQ